MYCEQRSLISKLNPSDAVGTIITDRHPTDPYGRVYAYGSTLDEWRAVLLLVHRSIPGTLDFPALCRATVGLNANINLYGAGVGVGFGGAGLDGAVAAGAFARWLWS